MLNKIKKYSLYIIAVMLILIPIIFYIYNFSYGISNKTSDWANFGTFLSGIYTPILSILTLLLLYKQYIVQRNLNIYQENQKYLDNFRDTLHMFTDNLQIIL
ncbi:MAG: hypothetical protein RLZZ210_1681, partial [Pseudomonadota bacterium]